MVKQCIEKRALLKGTGFRSLVCAVPFIEGTCIDNSQGVGLKGKIKINSVGFPGVK